MAQFILNDQEYSISNLPGFTSTGGAGFGWVKRNGVWVNPGVNAPLYGDDGLGVWEARTNSIRNPVMAGAGGSKVGTGTINGDVPNNMEAFAASGLTVSLSKMTINGQTFLIAEVSGTPAASPHFSVYYEQRSVVAANAQLWVTQVEIAAIAGSVSALGAVTQRLAMLDSGGLTLGELIGSDFKSSIGPAPGEFRYSATTNNASTAFVRPFTAFSGSGSPVSYTVAIGLPNLKQGPNINDPPILQTSGLAATRTVVAQSVGGLTPPSGDWTISGSAQMLGDTGTTQRFVDWNDGSDGNKIAVERNPSGAVLFTSRRAASSTTVATFNSKGGARIIDWSLSRVGGNLIATCDGVEASPAATTAPSGLNAVQLGAFRGGGGGWLNGNLRQVRLRYG